MSKKIYIGSTEIAGGDGRSAYQIWLDEGNVGTEEQFMASLNGVGIASVTQTTTSSVDGGTNVWTVTKTDGTSSTFQVKNGNQGNSGYSGAAGELEVVNNLTSTDATAALSANMGRVLDEEISQLGLEVDDLGDTLQSEIDAITPIVIQGDVTNAPDEEDITTDTNDLLKFKDRIAGVGQKGYKILRKNATFASQVTETNTIYEIRYDFDLSDNFTLPTGSKLKFEGGTINTNGYTLSGAIENEYIMPEWFGAKGDGTTDDTQAFKTVASLVNFGSAGRIQLMKKTYKLTAPIQFSSDIDFNGNGAKILFRLPSAQAAGFRGLQFTKTNDYTYIDVGTISGSSGSNEITVEDASGLSAGDYIIIYNSNAKSWGNEKDEYRQGDILKIMSISGTTITTTEPLTDNYSGASIQLYKLNPVCVNLRNLEIEGYCVESTTSNTIVPIEAKSAVDSRFENLTLYGSNISHLYLQHCYNVIISGVIVDFNSASVSLNYGITVGSSKNVRVSDSALKTGRHGLTIGGSDNIIIPSRYISVQGCSLDTYSAANSSLDSHGNAQFVDFLDNDIRGGIDMSASNFRIIGNRITRSASRSSTVYVVNTRFHSGEIANNEIHWRDTNSADSGVCLYTSVDADSDSQISISNNKFFIDSIAANKTSFGLHIRVINGANTISRLIVEDNKFYGPTNNIYQKAVYWRDCTLGSLLIRGNYVEGGVQNETTAVVDRTEITNNEFKAEGYSSVTINNGGSLCLVNKNTFLTNNYAITFNGTTQNASSDFIVDSNLFVIDIASAGRAAINSSKSKSTTFTNNTVISYTAGASKYLNDQYIINASLAVIRGNSYNAVNPVRLYTNTSVVAYKRDVGPTTARNYNREGDTYFDTNLGKMIVWNGTAWVNMDGTALS